MAEDSSVLRDAGRNHLRAPVEQNQQQQPQIQPTPLHKASDSAEFTSELPDYSPQESDGFVRTGTASTSGLPIGRRMRLTLGQKREVVDLAASKKFTHRELAEKFCVGRTTITNICRQEDLIRTETDSADATKKKRKTTKCTYDLRVLDECLHKWRMEVKVSSPDTKLTGTVLQHKAMEMACKLVQEPYAALPDKVKHALQKFTGSNGWLDGYRTRFGSFSSKQLPSGGDQSVIKSVDIQTRLRELHHAFSGAELDDIWTGSEFAVVYHPNAASGNGKSNGRFTVSLFVSAAGEKHDLQVIGTNHKPLMLGGIDTKKTYSIQYGYSKSGWQVAQTTVSMLKSLNALARARKRTFRVVLDSAVPHVKAAMILDSQGDQRTFFVYDHLQIYFLPPNFKTLRFHPCHLGVIQAFKTIFRCEMVETLFNNYRLSLMTPNSRGFHPQRHLHTRNVFHWFCVALHSLNKHLIQSCWVRSGLLPTQAIASLNLRLVLSHSSTNSSPFNAVSNKVISNTDRSNGSATSEANGIIGSSLTNSAGFPVSSNGGVPSAVPHYTELQQLLTNIAHVAPDILRWIGVSDPSNAQAFVDLEGNASVTDPGIDEVQIIRGVLQKHGYLSSLRLDSSHTDDTYESLEDVADESCPRHEEVISSINILKRYLRLSPDTISSRTSLIVQLNEVKRAVNVASSTRTF
ncbi:tigger transposable element-derived protein 4-like [Plasmopara halstedii]|uniref:Tigger transposable element-derived protein 4-like n=1 Tax=Plasmopara halstedii TaxID=4781 RepID=A0A0P1B6J9_PLAHL|nr:tigger transposable element-derived protein 4-like [Plasmopara halstedii]CEG49516.1 tigger transposable element-derived protein 4-like [Plasmopara halstedii]|eukprot:XP_024585885.1 tigger transposable element-derived protein 4-like [Plasmopara halstedii]